MNNISREDNNVNVARFRLETGIEILEDWAETASQNQQNAIYKALFAMADGSAFRTYRIVDDFKRANELFIVVRDDLVLKVRINCYDSFGVVFIGSVAQAPGLMPGR